MGVQITETTLRDGHQSLIATRMRTRDMLPIAEKLDEAGFFSLEVWGGATFDACIRFLNEDPWETYRLFKRKLRNTMKIMPTAACINMFSKGVFFKLKNNIL